MITITISADNLDYDAMIDRFLPQLTEKLQATGNPIGMLLSNGMPASMAKKIIHGLPQQKKDELAADLLNQYKGRLVQQAEQMMENQGIRMDITDVQVTAK